MAATTKLTLWPKLSQLIRLINTQPALHSNFRSSKVVEPLDQYPEVEIVHNAPEWKYVERLLPPRIVPQPKPKESYPSGWQPQTANASERSYYIARTKNHMVPVYLHTRFRGQRRLTVVRRVQGDIWALERDLRAVVESARNGKLCASRVNELSGQIYFHGDYVDVLRDHLKSQGF
ncbi:probable 39S ribosomal protein L49, mitochondrial isoform X2 [Scaptodrosophila lebanonensis]|uniref:Large ribosomal subunit protein mL49 n=1 Tax=Drosophila lebanonensis TaxID=7225 RepID=A0A6J2U0W6_DROLE|nr:probable 39S ribosomal protein L49, mitochondrial isoform X2 [Scaptodrosophila lebanonensis]